MIKVSFVTNGRTPYRKKQFEIYSEIPNVKFSIYYTNKNILEREWDVNKIGGVEEIPLMGIRISQKYGFINFGLKRIVKESDLILIGGYEQPTYQILAWLCRRYDKKYVIVFDGISPVKIYLSNRNGLKYFFEEINYRWGFGNFW